MRFLRWSIGAWVVLLLAGSAAARGAYNCLPTCDSTDARFLAIANGAGFVTLSQPTLELEISVPRGTTSFTVGFFDGDARGTDPGGSPHWDQGSPATFSYTLYPDPLRDHSSVTPIPLSGSPSVPSTDMPDNAWIDYTVSTDPSAQAPSGHYFYRLSIHLLTPAAVVVNAFKVRTGGANVGGSSLFPTPEPFSYIANVSNLADLSIVYPAFPVATPTLFDGSFEFFYSQPVSELETTVWDGDFDFGKFDGSIKDTDDPDTSNAPFLPSWATSDTLPEGVAVGLGGATGSPPDDRNPAGTGIYLGRPPSISYDLIFPNGQTFRNDDPSGNQEWERFTISTAPFDRSQMDFHADAVPPGIYQVKIQGLDMQNLNALLLPGRALCVSEKGVPCTPLFPYLLGDSVFADANGNGIQDPGEAGIPGVTLGLFDERGYPLGTAVTDSSGVYGFDVDSYSYTARVTSPPAGYLATTSDQCQAAISTANVLTCDFGYRGSLSIGDRLWNDTNSNGVQDPGETGINGVAIQLLNAGGTAAATTITSGDGNYSFQNLAPGTYTVRIVSGTLPPGAAATFDADGLATLHQITVNLTASRSDLDFGYRVPAGILSVGDRVWKDANANGLQDAGEAGINGVAVQLLNSSGTVIATTTTAGDGNYQFIELAPGTYTVRVVTATLASGFTPTRDLDGTATANQATLSLTASRSDVDFGYHFRSGGCTGTATLGYWKNHASAWPVQSITVGGVTYTKAQAISWLSTPPRGDATVSLFQQLVPAELNALAGNNVSCITAAIQAADAWLRQYPLNSHVSSSSSAGQTATDLQEQLDDYNNGRLCAPHRD